MVSKKNNKHAYLIIAHNEFEVLSYLLKLIDDSRNDIYLHIDKKSNYNNFEFLKKCVMKSQIKIFKQIDIRWGSESQVDCEIFLLEEARKKGKYEYYHILSGVDLPIKNQNYIHNFFDENTGKEFIHFDSKEISEKNKERVEYIHFFNNFYKKSKIKVFNYCIGKLDAWLVKIQKKLKVKKTIDFDILQKGCNWCSITDNFAQYVLDNKNKVHKLVHKSKCADEIFMQTLIINSEYKENLYMNDFNNNHHACMRLIIWDKENVKSPKVFGNDDYKMLMESDEIFARKFCWDKSKDLIMKIYSEIRRNL